MSQRPGSLDFKLGGTLLLPAFPRPTVASTLLGLSWSRQQDWIRLARVWPALQTPPSPSRGLGPSDPGCAPGSWDSRNQRGVPQEGSGGGKWISGPTTRQAGEATGPEFQANWRLAECTPQPQPAFLPGLCADHPPKPDCRGRPRKPLTGRFPSQQAPRWLGSGPGRCVSLTSGPEHCNEASQRHRRAPEACRGDYRRLVNTDRKMHLL